MFIKPKSWTHETVNSCYLSSMRLQQRGRVLHSFSYTCVFWQFLMIGLHVAYTQQKHLLILPFQKKGEERKGKRKKKSQMLKFSRKKEKLSFFFLFLLNLT